ncbi:MAG: TIGR03862 family flavoprotein [Fluviibacter sp.]
MNLTESAAKHIAIIGGGPAGLMAAEALSQTGVQIDVYDAMPSVGRKFLLAGIGGLNITHNEDYAQFCSRFASSIGSEQSLPQEVLDGFTPEALRAWAMGLGIETFVGTSGRVFPKEMKAAPLLRAWLHRLRNAGVRLHVRHRWQGWTTDGALRLTHPSGETILRPDATILALGGASWPKLGSDGAWLPLLQSQDVHIAPLHSANCGFDVPWSALLKTKYAGEPLKSVRLSLTDAQGNIHQRTGECVISRQGIEGGLVYAVSRPLREMIEAKGSATFSLDLAPDRTMDRVLDILCRRGTKSLSSYLKSALGFSAIKTALLYEVLSKEQLNDLRTLAASIKALPITVQTPRPIAEAISTAGGICFNSIDKHLMLKGRPGVFVAGEMLDWEAPTGGYLLTGCLATGRHAGLGAYRWVQAPT